MRLPFLKPKIKPLKPEEVADRLAKIPTTESIESIVRQINKKKEHREYWNSLTPRQQEKWLRYYINRRLVNGTKK